MAGKTNLSATLFSQKKLLGKSSTGTHRADSNEPIPSGVQVAASTIFSEAIPSSPSATLFQIQSASLNGASTVEYVEFVVEPVTGSTYDANSFDGDASAQGSGVHAYRLVLTGTYNANSNNPKAGSFPFRDNQILHWTLGGLQLVGPQFSNDVPNPYNLTIYSGSRDVDDQIPLLDEIDWQIDYYSGILFVQDYDAGKIPTRAKGFIYVGNMLSASLGHASGSNSGGGGSGDGKDVGWFQSGNSAISTTGSLYIGTSTTADPEIFFSSVGAAIFNEQGRDVDFRIESSNKTHAFTVDAGTDQVLILSGGSGRSFNEPGANDVNFYVSGSVGSRGTITRGTSVFGGDVVVSGTLYDGNGNEIGGGSGTVTSGTFLEPAAGHLVQTGSVSLAGSKGFSYKTSDVGLDTFFFVSGAIDSRDTTTAGAAVFSGDVIVSGTLSVNRGQSGVGSMFTITSDGKVGIGSDTPAYKLSVGGNMDVGEYIYHKNDADTFIHFADDSIGITTGNEQLVTIAQQDAGQDFVKIGDGGDVDFQVRTDGDDNTLYVEGNSDRVGIGTNVPDYKLDVAGDIGIDEYIYHNGDDNTFIRFMNDQIRINAGGRPMIRLLEGTSDQVLILSGGGETSTNPTSFADTNFFVSGSIGSRGSVDPGSSVFGGDMVVSGTGHMGGMMPLQDNTYNLGSPSLRFANIYTGDLHLRNERGHWQLIEEEDCLTVTNKLTDKRYKIVLEPYEEASEADS